MESFSPRGLRARSALSLRSLRRPAAALGVIATAALLAGCGAASSSSGTTNATSSTTATTSGAGFDPSLVPGAGSSPGKTFPKPKAGKKGTASKKRGSSSSSSHASSGPTAVIAPSKPVTRTVTHTVTVSHTVTHTVVHTKYVRPHVPAGAGLPSTKHAYSVSRFGAAGGNIGCAISGGTVRCDVGRRVWRAGRRPKSCHSAWGQGIYVASTGGAHFVCAGNSVLDPNGTYIRAGYDDKVGSVTCQVRSFGVTCFESRGAGFFIGRTGYTMF